MGIKTTLCETNNSRKEWKYPLLVIERNNPTNIFYAVAPNTRFGDQDYFFGIELANDSSVAHKNSTKDGTLCSYFKHVFVEFNGKIEMENED